MIEYILSLSVISILVFLFALLFYVVKMYEKNKKIEEFINNNDQLILDQAHQKAKSIVEAAVLRAKATMQETDLLREDLVKKMEDFIEEAAKKDVALLGTQTDQSKQMYQNMLQQIRQEHIKKAGETLASIEQITQGELEQFRQTLERQTIEQEKMVSEKVNAQYAKVEQEITQLREQKLKDIESQVKKLILQVTEDTLGKVITISEHEAIIMQALEKAKKENAFD